MDKSTVCIVQHQQGQKSLRMKLKKLEPSKMNKQRWRVQNLRKCILNKTLVMALSIPAPLSTTSRAELFNVLSHPQHETHEADKFCDFPGI